MLPLKRFLDAFFEDPHAKPIEVSVDDKVVPIKLRRNAQARRLTLRMLQGGKGAVITLPRNVSRVEAERFAEKSKTWIAKQLEKTLPYQPFENGARVMFRGETVTIISTGFARGVVRFDPVLNAILVPGDFAHIARRVTDFMKAEARKNLEEATRRYASQMGLTFRKISIRDQKSRWGSCSSDKDLSYSWRLIMAPNYVLDYVAAHEVAHLHEMNHSQRFWRLVLVNCPDSKRAKHWLKMHGKSVHSFG